MSKQPHHYTECGLTNIYLVNGFEEVETPRGSGIVIHDIDGLHEAIGKHLVREKKRLNGKEIRFLRYELGLSQENLGLWLDVNAQAVARWEKGRSKVPGAADKMLRVLYSEHIGGNRSIRKLCRDLAKLDEMKAEKLGFAQADGGWRITELRDSAA